MVKMSMADCIVEFEHLHHKMTDQKMSSPNELTDCTDLEFSKRFKTF